VELEWSQNGAEAELVARIPRTPADKRLAKRRLGGRESSSVDVDPELPPDIRREVLEVLVGRQDAHTTKAWKRPSCQPCRLRENGHVHILGERAVDPAARSALLPYRLRALRVPARLAVRERLHSVLEPRVEGQDPVEVLRFRLR